MADAAATGGTGMKTLKTIFTLGAVGMVATLGGTLLLPFFGAAATAGVTNAQVLGSFWAPLFTSTTGEVGATAGIGKIFSGVASLFKSGFAVVAAAFDPNITMSEALAAPAYA